MCVHHSAEVVKRNLSPLKMRNPCCDDRKGINRGAWSNEEDQKLVDYIRVHGEGCWRSLPKAAGLLRCGKSCRLRWINYLRPDVKRGNFKEDEADLIIRLHALLGNRWSLIAGRLPGRTDNEVKNYWNSHLRKKLASMGIDPDNHRVVASSTSLFYRSQSSIDSATPSSGDVDNSIDGAVEECWHFNYGSRPDQTNSGERLPDLNLDLTICIPRPEGDHDSAGKPSTTLVLFR